MLAEQPGLVREERRAALSAKMIDMPAAIAAGQTDFMAMGMDRAYCGALPRRPPRRAADVRDARRHAGGARPRGGGVLTYEDIARARHRELVRRPQRRGGPRRADCADRARGPTTYAEKLAALVNRSGLHPPRAGVRAEERVLLVLGDGVELVALWYEAQKIGAVTAEAYTFLQPKDYAYYLDYARAGVVVADASTLERVREAATRAAGCGTCSSSGRMRSPPRRGLIRGARRGGAQAPTTRDLALWKFTTGSTGCPRRRCTRSTARC